MPFDPARGGGRPTLTVDLSWTRRGLLGRDLAWTRRGLLGRDLSWDASWPVGPGSVVDVSWEELISVRQGVRVWGIVMRRFVSRPWEEVGGVRSNMHTLPHLISARQGIGVQGIVIWERHAGCVQQSRLCVEVFSVFSNVWNLDSGVELFLFGHH